MADDWDLYAIVRSCNSGTAANATATGESGSFENPLDCLAALSFEEEDDPFSQPRKRCLQELQDSYKPFLGSSTNSSGQGNVLDSPIPDFEGYSAQIQPQFVLQHHHQQQQQQQKQLFSTNTSISSRFEVQHVEQNQWQQQLHQLQGTQRPVSGTNPLRPTQSPAPRSRKKKSNQKRLVLQVTAENLSNDEWAWRKYGQKPIKGSPYPRNYYRCSSSKGCAARKQVERSNKDPTLFIVSYTGDHIHPRPTHRNSLAGSTRTKLPPTHKAPNKESDPPPAPAENTLATSRRSPKAPLSATNDNNAADDGINTTEIISMESVDDDCDEEEDDDDGDGDDILIPSNIALNEDLIKNLDELGSVVAGHSPAFGDNFSSWVVGGSAAAAGAGATTGSGDN